MTTKEKWLISVIKPFLPQIKQQLNPAMEALIEGRLKEIDTNKPLPDTTPAILILQDGNSDIYVCDCLMQGKTVQAIRRRLPLATLTNQIVSLLTDA